LAALTTDFRRLWDDPATANRERKRLLAHIIEDATLIKIQAEGITRIHVRFNLNPEVKSMGSVFAVETGQAGATGTNFGEIV
jgi:hypothetical protein